MAFDWSFLPIICWGSAVAFFIWHFFSTYVLRNKETSTLLRAHYLLLRCGRYDANSSRLQRTIKAIIKQKISMGSAGNFSPATAKEISASTFLEFKQWGGIVLKAPRINGGKVVEKGVLALRFNKGFSIFRSCVNVTAVIQSYVLVLEPGWSGYANQDILYFTRFPDSPVIVMATEKSDYEFLKNHRCNLIPVSIGAGDWVHPGIFHPLANEEKKFDAVMVAKWKLFKRHHVLFRALRKLKDASFKVALVGIHLPEQQSEARLLMSAYGISDNVSLFGLLDQSDVNLILNQSKVNLILSLQEGSNKALFEGFFAGTPGLTLLNNVGIQKDYFTPQTGKLIQESRLKETLLYFRECWAEYKPRPWAESNIAPIVTTAKLNIILKELSQKCGEEWRQDLAVKCNTPWSRYYPDEMAGRDLPSFEEILHQYAR